MLICPENNLFKDEVKKYRLFENGNITVTGHHRARADHYTTSEIKEKERAGQTVKRYAITNAHYRSISSAAVRLWEGKRNNIVFITLTFPVPQNIGKHTRRTRRLVYDYYSNLCFSKFVDNLTHNYGLYGYIAVKEKTGVGYPHFHLLADIPYFDPVAVNNAWVKTFEQFMPRSKNAMRLGSPEHGTVVKSKARAVRYLCKYMSKVRQGDKKNRVPLHRPGEDPQYYDNRSYYRVIFHSHNITSKPLQIDWPDFLDLIDEYKYRQYKYDYCTIVLLKDTDRRDSKFFRFFTDLDQFSIGFQHSFP